jgi:hypothetical protein
MTFASPATGLYGIAPKGMSSRGINVAFRTITTAAGQEGRT